MRFLDSFLVDFLRSRESRAREFDNRSIIVSSGSGSSLAGRGGSGGRIGTAVNKNPGLIFFEQYHRCSCPPVRRVATLFSPTVQSLPTERNSCRHSKRKLMVLLPSLSPRPPARARGWLRENLSRDLAAKDLSAPMSEQKEREIGRGYAKLSAKNAKYSREEAFSRARSALENDPRKRVCSPKSSRQEDKVVLDSFVDPHR